MSNFKCLVSIVFLAVLSNKVCSSEYGEQDGVRGVRHKVAQLEQITGYLFQHEQVLHHFFTHHSIPGGSKFKKLAFLGDKVIGSIVAFSTFDLEKSVGDLHRNFENQTTNKHFAKKTKHLGLNRLIRYNPENDLDTMAADTFEALVGAIQLDFEKHPSQISPAAINFVTKVLNLPSLPHGSPLVHKISRKDSNDHLMTLSQTSVDRDRNVDMWGVGLVGAVTGIGALWSWFSGPDYKKMYEECNVKKNIYGSLCIVLLGILCWPHISFYL